MSPIDIQGAVALPKVTTFVEHLAAGIGHMLAGTSDA
jgi:hypothetical protein